MEEECRKGGSSSSEQSCCSSQGIVYRKKKMLDFPSEHFPLIDILYLSELKKSNTLPIEDKYARMQIRIRYPAFSFLTHKSTS